MFRLLLITIPVLAVATATPAFADSAADKVAIMQRLETWRAAFNGRDAAGACSVFAADLLYSVPEVARGTRKSMCANLSKMLTRPELQLSYGTPDIHEIMVVGDVAVVRLTWTLTAKAKGVADTAAEEGMDLFRRQPDGGWSISRFVAFTVRPNKSL